MLKWAPEIPDERALQSLRSGLGLVGSGCTEDFTTRLVPRGGRGCVNPHRALVSSDFARSTESFLHPALLSAEQRQLRKHGTYSRRPPYLTPDDTGVSLDVLVRRYFEPHVCRMVHGEALRVADNAVMGLYDVRQGGLQLCSLRDAHESFLKSRTGLGWPIFSSDPQFYPQVCAMSATLIRAGYPTESIYYYPGCIGIRGQPRGNGPFCKFRAIYQGSRVIGNLEKMVQIPVLNALRHCEVFCAWAGKDFVDAAVTRLMRTSKLPLVSIDFAGFDASIPEGVIRRIFNLIKTWFDRPWHGHINYLRDVFCSCGIFTPNGFYEGEGRSGGVPSGSVLTNLIDSLVNLWLVHYAATVSGGRVLDALVQGDDGVYRLHKTTLARISDVLLTEFGMVLSVEKSLVSTSEVQFLQNVHSRDFKVNGTYVGVRPLMRVLNGMMSYEDVNRRWDKSFDSYRWLQQLENASTHPSFNLACKWLLEKDACMESAIVAILENRRSVLDAVRAALCGKYEWGKVAVDGLLTTKVFQQMLTILRVS